MTSTEKIIAFIPLREDNSKNIPLKNIKPIGGKPLVYWIVLSAQLSNSIEEIYVSTDSKDVKETVKDFKFSKVKIIDKISGTCMDPVVIENAMLEFAEKVNFEYIILLQAAFPLITYFDIENALKTCRENKYDSILSVVRKKQLIWDIDKDNYAKPTNYNLFKRPRRQDINGYLIENGAIYITKRDLLIKNRCRISGKIGLYEMSNEKYFELDEPNNWLIVELLMRNIKEYYLNYWLRNIKVLCLDVDGVLTDGGVYYGEDGERMLKFSRIDGKGIELLKKHGVDIWIISAEDSQIVRRRMNKLNIDKVHLNIKDKITLIKELSLKYNIRRDEIAYIGDDIQDLEVIRWVGFSASPKNGIDIVKNNVSYICNQKGGQGAVREIIDLIVNTKTSLII